MRFALISCIVALAIIGSPSAAQAQQAEDGSYQAMSDKFFDFLQQDKPADALDSLLATNPALRKNTAELTSQFNAFRSHAGPYVSNFMLVESKVGGVYVYQHFFVAYERQPISVRITYYKRGANWVCRGLLFDTNVDDLIQKAADNNLRMDLK